MSDEPTERDVETVAEATADRVTWDDGTEYISVKDAAQLVAQARREGAAEALKAAANRVAVATTPHSATFDAYMHASQIVRETALRGDA